MKRYITNLLTEKGIITDISQDMNIDGHIGLTYEMQIDFICDCPDHMIKQMRATFVKIDYLNGNVKHYWDHLTKGMLASLGY